MIVAAPRATHAARAARSGGDKSNTTHDAPAPPPQSGWKNRNTRGGNASAGRDVVAATMSCPGPPSAPPSPAAAPVALNVCSSVSQRCDGITPAISPSFHSSSIASPPAPAPAMPAQSAGKSAAASAHASRRLRCNSDGDRAAHRSGSLSPCTHPTAGSPPPAARRLARLTVNDGTPWRTCTSAARDAPWPCAPEPHRRMRTGAAAASYAAVFSASFPPSLPPPSRSSSRSSSSSSSSSSSLEAPRSAAAATSPSRTPALNSTASASRAPPFEALTASAIVESRGAPASINALSAVKTLDESAGARCRGNGAPIVVSAPPAADRSAHGPVAVCIATAQSFAVTRNPARLDDALANASRKSFAAAAASFGSNGSTGASGGGVSISPAAAFAAASFILLVSTAAAIACAGVIPSSCISNHFPIGMSWYPSPPRNPFPGSITTLMDDFHFFATLPQCASHFLGSNSSCLPSKVAL
eukprot:26343-Pelagococcus_subviridis.AAC.12